MAFLSIKSIHSFAKICCCLTASVLFADGEAFCQSSSSSSNNSFISKLGSVISKGSVEAKLDLRVHNRIYREAVRYSNTSGSADLMRSEIVKKLRPHLKHELREARELLGQMEVGTSLRSLFNPSHERKLAAKDIFVYDIVVNEVKGSSKLDLQASLGPNPDFSSFQKNETDWNIEAVEKPNLNDLRYVADEDNSLDLEIRAGLKRGKPRLSVYDSNKYYRVELSSYEGLTQQINLPISDLANFTVKHLHETQSTIFVVDTGLNRNASRVYLEYSTEDNSFTTTFEKACSESVLGFDITLPEDASTKNFDMQVSLGMQF